MLRASVGYGDSFTVLMENGIISAELAEKMKMIAGFRKCVLVHDYLEIDHKIVYDSLHRLGDCIESIKSLIEVKRYILTLFNGRYISRCFIIFVSMPPMALS